MVPASRHFAAAAAFGEKGELRREGSQMKKGEEHSRHTNHHEVSLP